MYVVTGASGQTGAAAAQALLDAGESVTVILRDPAKGTRWEARGATVVVADLTDAGAITAALRGAAGAYLINPPAYRAEDPFAECERVTTALAAAVRESALPHAVILSSLGAERSEGTGMIQTNHILEERLRATGRPITTLRPSSFMENVAGLVNLARTEGIYPSMQQPLDRAFPFVATADIGAVAATLLRDGPLGDGLRVVQLCGPREYTPQDIATAFGRELGRPVTAVAPPRAEWEKSLRDAGLGAAAARELAALYEGLNAGRIEVLPEFELRRGSTPLEPVIGQLVEATR